MVVGPITFQGYVAPQGGPGSPGPLPKVRHISLNVHSASVLAARRSIAALSCLSCLVLSPAWSLLWPLSSCYILVVSFYLPTSLALCCAACFVANQLALSTPSAHPLSLCFSFSFSFFSALFILPSSPLALSVDRLRDPRQPPPYASPHLRLRPPTLPARCHNAPRALYSAQ